MGINVRNKEEFYGDLLGSEEVPIGISAVYFLSDSNGHIKIGKTNDVSRRMIELQTTCPTEVKLFSYYPCKISELSKNETDLHHVFKFCRRYGEWFDEQPVMDYIVLQGGWWYSRLLGAECFFDKKMKHSEACDYARELWFSQIKNLLMEGKK